MPTTLLIVSWDCSVLGLPAVPCADVPDADVPGNLCLLCVCLCVCVCSLGCNCFTTLSFVVVVVFNGKLNAYFAISLLLSSTGFQHTSKYLGGKLTGVSSIVY